MSLSITKHTPQTKGFQTFFQWRNTGIAWQIPLKQIGYFKYTWSKNISQKRITSLFYRDGHLFVEKEFQCLPY